MNWLVKLFFPSWPAAGPGGLRPHPARRRGRAAEKILPERVSFSRHVKPLLSDRCFACHGPDKAKQQAGLRLDLPESAYAHESDETGRRAIVPGDWAASELARRILSADPKVVMPTPESHLSLTAEEKAPAAALDRAGRGIRAALGVRGPAKTQFSRRKKHGLGADGHRPVRAGEPRIPQTPTRAGSRKSHAAAPGSALI